MENKVNLALIASGGGTDANAIMEAYCQKRIPNVNLKFLIGTKADAGCLEKARKHNIPSYIIDRQFLGREKFNEQLQELLWRKNIQLVFLVGCIVKIPFVLGVIFRNIHPADIKSAGGKGMYGLKPHEKVLSDIKAWVDDGLARKDEDFYTYPTVHKAVEKRDQGIEEDFDSGMPIMRISLKIPKSIILPYLEGKQNLETSAKALQAYVLPYEWRLLPLAVEIAAQQILDEMLEA